MITHDDLRAAGFTRHRAGRPYAIALWELRVEDPSRLEAPRSYSIHLYEYNPPDFYPGLPAASVDEHRWEAEAFLYLPGPQMPPGCADRCASLLGHLGGIPGPL